MAFAAILKIKMEQMDLTNDKAEESSTDNESQDPIDKDKSHHNTIKKLTKKDIENLILQKSERISAKDTKLKSDVWKRFKIVSVDGILQDCVICSTCKIIYSWKSKNGTKSLKRHACESNAATEKRKRGPATPLTVVKFESIQNYLLKAVPPYAKAALNKSIAFGLAKDLHSLRTVEGAGFQHMAQSLINFGATYGRQRVEDNIQHRTTLRDHYITDMCDETRQKYKMLFDTMPRTHKFSFSKDLWSEKWQKRTFMSLSCHFINDNWKLEEIMLGLDEMVEGKTTADIRKKCFEILKLYFDETRAEEIIENSFAVTDGGSSMLKVFVKRLACECHKLNTFVQWILNENKLPDKEKILARAASGNPYSPIKLFNLQTCCPAIYETLSGVRKTVTYFKQSHINASLPTTLKQAVETRWDSCLEMMESYDKVKEEVETLLLKQRKLEKIKDIDHDLLNELIEFLRPIRKCSKTLSGDKYPTINLVAVSYAELKDKIWEFKTKSDAMKSLVEQAKLCFKKYIVTSDIHHMACLLDPRYRQLKFASRNNRRDAVSDLKRLVEKQEDLIENSTTPVNVPLTSTPKTTKTKSTRFEKYQDEAVDPDCEMPEVLRYLDEKFDLPKYNDEAGNFQLLKRTLLSGTSLSELLYVHKCVEPPVSF